MEGELGYGLVFEVCKEKHQEASRFSTAVPPWDALKSRTSWLVMWEYGDGQVRGNLGSGRPHRKPTDKIRSHSGIGARAGSH